MRRFTPIATLAALLGLVMSTPVLGNLWAGAGADDLWSNVDHWSQGIVPINSLLDPRFGWDDPDGMAHPLTPDPSADGVQPGNATSLAPGNSDHRSGLGKTLRVVERTLSRLRQIRRLHVRYQRRDDIHAPRWQLDDLKYA